MREKIEDFNPGEVYYIADFDCYALITKRETRRHEIITHKTEENGDVVQVKKELVNRLVCTNTTQMKLAVGLHLAMGMGFEPADGEYFEVINNGVSYKFGYRYYRNFIENNDIDKGLRHLSDEPVFVLQPSELRNFMDGLRRYEQEHPTGER